MSRQLSPADFERVASFWTKGGGAGNLNTRERFEAFLRRNPGLSFKLVEKNLVVGTILCGHDGTRGYLHHFAISDRLNGQGLGKLMINRSLEGLRSLGIGKCHLFIDTYKSEGLELTQLPGWSEQHDLRIYSHDIEFPGT